MGNRKTNLGNVQTDEYRRKKKLQLDHIHILLGRQEMLSINVNSKQRADRVHFQNTHSGDLSGIMR